jgi:hypothetical protein
MTMWDQVTDEQREGIAREIIAGLQAHAVRDHLRAGLIRYFVDGLLPGGFLQAVLCNDLTQAVTRAADGATLAGIPNLTLCLLAHAPSAAWGSRDAVRAWTITPDRLEV